MKTLNCLLFSVLLATGVLPAQAVTITASAPAFVSLGDTFSVDLNVSGLGDTAATTLGTYDLDLLFDPSIVSALGVSFGSGLDVLGLGSLQLATFNPSSVNLFELSLDTIANLVALQPNAFSLATLTFKALATGTSPFNVVVNAFGDAAGDPLSASVTPGAVTVSEPATCLMLLSGLGLMGLARRRSEDHSAVNLQLAA